ncbi:hypothetical protein [Hoeflea ulvae]|uniref:Uncharacterized protein n=1 Tax=Hoeflea ulvae TaxID=2983764 RepID=A0ABT3YE21_9HYPH|nr:hypothetical protein [Hoeflea ulvae]MCY0093917.1 hypothetical protein [Hoeflea ulvae]
MAVKMSDSSENRGAELTPTCPVSSERFAQQETGTIIRIGGEPMIGTTVVMAGLLSSSAISGKRKVRPCEFPQVCIFLFATDEVKMTQGNKKTTQGTEHVSRGPSIGKKRKKMRLSVHCHSPSPYEEIFLINE